MSRDVRLAAAGLSLIAVCYGPAWFAYGLFPPVLTEEFGLDGARGHPRVDRLYRLLRGDCGGHYRSVGCQGGSRRGRGRRRLHRHDRIVAVGVRIYPDHPAFGVGAPFFLIAPGASCRLAAHRVAIGCDRGDSRFRHCRGGASIGAAVRPR